MGSVSSLELRPSDSIPKLRTVAAAARMYDYYLGGKDNYAADRALADRVLEQAPVVLRLVRANRRFLVETARYLAEIGLRQFLDVGCGLPVADGGVGRAVRDVDPRSRIAYVDNDPMVISHARALLATEVGTGVLMSDLRDTGALLGHRELRPLIDPERPVAVFLTNVLHFLSDAEDPGAVLGALAARLAPGSRVVVTHALRTPELAAAAELYTEADVQFAPRDAAALARICGGLEPSAGPCGRGADAALWTFVGRVPPRPRPDAADQS